jgi:RimJ/RimL family protein N-acetyltransferase
VARRRLLRLPHRGAAVNEATSTAGAASAPGLRIRPYRRDDAPALFDAARESIATVGPWLPWCHAAYALSEAEGWAASQEAAFRNASEYEFVIESDEGRFLGGCGLNQLDRFNRRANLGYWVRASATGRGVATRAARLLTNWAVLETDLDRLEIVVALGNRASLRVAEKVGGVREGILRHRLWIHGVAHDAVIFSLLRPSGS